MRVAWKNILICAAAFAVCAAAMRSNAQIEIPVPESHWALESLADLAGGNLVPGYAQSDFRGRRTFARREIARVISAIIDHNTMHSDAFSDRDVALLDRLRAEFDEELKEMGEIRLPKASRPDPKVPLSHWAYAAFADFAGRGLLPGEKAWRFLGGKIYTRGEMAALAEKLLELRIKNIEMFEEKDLKLLEYMEKEFAEELRGPDASPATVARADQPREVVITESGSMILIRGSSNLAARVSKGDKSDVSNRITLETRSPHVLANFTGTSDNSEPGVFRFSLTRKLVGFHSHLDDRERDSFLLAGDVTSIDFSRGLALGAVNLKGFYLSAAGRSASRVVVAWGNDDAGDELLAARFTSGAGVPWVWGAGAVKEYVAAEDERMSFSLDLKHETSSRRLLAERTWVEGAGSGLFMEWLRDFTSALKMKMEYRKYRDFILNHNSPPTYTGRSGGDGENEKSFYAGAEWRPSDRWALVINRDHAYNPETGRRTNLYHALERKLSDDFVVAVSGEKETGGDAPETERGVKLRYTGFGKTDLFSSWKRGLQAGAPSSTTRFDLSRPFLDKDGKFLYSFTRRKTTTKNTNTSTFRLSRQYGIGLTAGVTYNLSTNTQSRFDTNLSWKF